LWQERRRFIPPAWIDDAPELLRPLIDLRRDVEDVAFVTAYRGALTLDPVSGHVFDGRRFVPGSTDLPAERTRERLPRFWVHLAPPAERHEAVVSLHNKFDNNYFHFFNNVAAKLALVERLGIEASVPFVLPAAMAAQPYVKAAIELGLFAGRRLIVQAPGRAIAARRVYVVKAFDADRECLDLAMDRLGAVRRPPAQARRVFIARGPRSPNRRFFRNQAALDAMFARHGVESVDPQTLSLGEQIDLFARADLIVAPHGAGMTNIIFRRGAPTRVVELFNPSLMSLHYYLLARAYGYDYHALANHGVEGRNSVASSLADLDAIEALLARQPSVP
jgi:capsular polysaccharide biosynthesis protein